MRNLITALLLALLFTGCRSLGVGEGASARCFDLADQYRLYGAIAVATAVLGGSGGIATAQPADEDLRLGLGVTAAGLGAIGAAASFLQEDLLSEYSALACEGTETSTAVKLEF